MKGMGKILIMTALSVLLLTSTALVATAQKNDNRPIEFKGLGILDGLVELFPEVKEFKIMEINMGRDSYQNEVLHVLIGKGSSKKDQAQVDIDLQSGEIISYAGYKESSGNLSSNTAFRKASEFFKKMIGNQYKYYSIDFNAHGTVIYCREIKGVPFLSAGYSIFLDDNGKVRGFSKNRFGEKFVEKDFTDPADAISSEEAKEALPENFQESVLRLVYVLGDDRRPLLVYEAKNDEGYAFVDALTGERIQLEY